MTPIVFRILNRKFLGILDPDPSLLVLYVSDPDPALYPSINRQNIKNQENLDCYSFVTS
jgi:hypothetical protein